MLTHYHAQDLLNMLHHINIPDIYASALTNEAAAEIIGQKLKEIRTRLWNSVKAIEENSVSITLDVEPYSLIETLLTRLEARNVELKTSGLRKPYPFGRIIYGTTREWHIGSEREEQLWVLNQEKQARLIQLRHNHDEVLSQLRDKIDTIKSNAMKIKRAYEAQLEQEVAAAEALTEKIESVSNEVQTTFELNHNTWKYTAIMLIGSLLVGCVIVWAAYNIIESIAEPPFSTFIFATILVAILGIGISLVFGFTMAGRDSQLQSKKAEADITELEAAKSEVVSELEPRLAHLSQVYQRAMTQLNQQLKAAFSQEEAVRREFIIQRQEVETEFAHRVSELMDELTLADI